MSSVSHMPLPNDVYYYKMSYYSVLKINSADRASLPVRELAMSGVSDKREQNGPEWTISCLQQSL